MTASLSTRPLTLSLGTAQQQRIQTQPIQILGVKLAVHPSLNSTIGTAMGFSIGKMSMTTTTGLSTCSTLTGIATSTMMETFTLSTVHCTETMDQTLWIQTLMETV